LAIGLLADGLISSDFAASFSSMSIWSRGFFFGGGCSSSVESDWTWIDGGGVDDVSFSSFGDEGAG
jgi:hypothetical protein